MGFLDSVFEGIKSTLKWKVQSGVTTGLEKGIGAVAGVLKSKNKCPECKKPLKELGAKFCPYCRAKLVLICPNEECKRESPLGTQFCSSCGTTLLKAEK